MHVDCMAVKGSVNAFEGLKGYWQPEGAFAIVQLRQHYNRLQRSARLLDIPFEMKLQQYRNAIASLWGAART